MLIPILSIVLGIALLLWSADRFIDGSASLARHFGMSPLLVGMVIVGFGTSAPEMIVSAISAYQGNPGLALGNAYGSNITNIGLILGLTALIKPISVHSQVLKKELPILTAISLLAAWQIKNGEVSRLDAILLLVVFGGLMAWTVFESIKNSSDALATELDEELKAPGMPLPKAVMWLVIGLGLLMASSRVLVWGAVEIAKTLGVSDLIIGLTIVAVGTSLPELASSILACRKGEHDIALGNVIGSNLFNTLAVVGIAGSIHPMTVGKEVFQRDIPVMLLFTLSLFAMGWGFKGTGRINRLEGVLLLMAYIGYNSYLIMSTF